MKLVLLILTSLSIVNIFQNESIFSWLRKLVKRINIKLYNFLVCPVCFGFWVGFFLSFVFNLHENIVLNSLICSFVSSIMNKFMAHLIPKQFDLE